MVLLTATPRIIEAIKLSNTIDGSPELEIPDPGGPIAHDTLISVSQNLQGYSTNVPEAGKDARDFLLDTLLRGTKVYIPPPAPKPEKTPEYLALMARLRREEEAKQYQRMLQHHEANTPSFQQTATLASQRGALFPPPDPSSTADDNDDEMTYKDINRQIALIANVLISILACSIGVWKTAWHWDVPARLALAMTSSIVVAVAEVAIYAGYIGRLEEAKGREKRKVERKRVVGSWRTEVGRGRRDGGRMAKDVLVGEEVVDKVLAEGLRFRERMGKPK